MNRTHIKKLSIAITLVFMAGGMLGQTKKKQSFNVNKDVVIDLNTSHTNIVFETWNQNKVEVETFIEGEGLSAEELRDQQKNWNVNITSTPSRVSIATSSKGTFHTMAPPLAAKELQMIAPMVMDMVGPMLENLPMAPLPEGFMNDMGDLKFDYKAYEKDPENYMKSWEEKMDKKFGKEFEKKMEAWGKEMSKNSEKSKKALKEWEEKHGAEFEKKMEAWGENFGAQMEAWGENFGKEMEAWGENYAPSFNAAAPLGKPNTRVKRTIIIRIPKDAKLDLNVRHGELKLAHLVKNMKATLNYTRLTANSIDGAKTSIIASYAPVTIQNWVTGNLNLKFVDRCAIEKIGNIQLDANSSNVYITRINEKAYINGSFGILELKEIGNKFSAIDMVFENSEANLKLPSTAFDFYYNGSRSKVKYPTSLKVTKTLSRDNELVRGYQSSANSPQSITISARFSDVVIH